MSIIKHVTLQKIVAHDFWYDPHNFISDLLWTGMGSSVSFVAFFKVPVLVTVLYMALYVLVNSYRLFVAFFKVPVPVTVAYGAVCTGK